MSSVAGTEAAKKSRPPLSEDHKAKMKAGREAAKARRDAAKSSATPTQDKVVLLYVCLRVEVEAL